MPLLCNFEAIPQAKILQFLPYQFQLPRTPKVHKTYEICTKEEVAGLTWRIDNFHFLKKKTKER